MSFLVCKCGHTIRDVEEEDSERLWGTIIPNGELWAMFDKLSKNLADFCTKFKQGDEKEWLQSHGLHRDLALEEALHDLLTIHYYEPGVTYAVCENCNAIHIQKSKKENNYMQFDPKG